MLNRLAGRYPIGAYYFTENLWNPEGVRQLAEMGVDFLVAVQPDKKLLALCERYKIGVIASGTFPMWWGGDGENAGGYEAAFPLETLDAARKSYPDSPALWGDYPVDEPNAKDFAHVGRVAAHYKEVYPSKIPFINLYPNYASVPKNTAAETVSQLGNPTYYEHIEQYLREIDLPYLCFDFYPYTGSPFDGYLENLDIAASACRRSGRELWVIVQTGAWKAEELLSEYQLRWQTSLCLAYGATSIMHASYCKGWWDASTSCVDEEGRKNPTYEYAKKINRELHAVGGDFLKYESTGVCVRGDLSHAHERIRPQLIAQNAQKDRGTPEIFCRIESDKAILAGCFQAKTGEGRALMAVNTHDPFDPAASASVTLFPDADCLLVHRGERCEGLSVPASGGVTLTLDSGEGVFIELIR